MRFRYVGLDIIKTYVYPTKWRYLNMYKYALDRYDVAFDTTANVCSLMRETINKILWKSQVQVPIVS